MLSETTFKLTVGLLASLSENPKPADHNQPTTGNLQELAIAIFSCPEFFESQKANMCSLFSHFGFRALTLGHDMNLYFGGSAITSASWPFHVLVLDHRAARHFVQGSHFYSNVHRQAQHLDKLNSGSAVKCVKRPRCKWLQSCTLMTKVLLVILKSNMAMPSPSRGRRGRNEDHRGHHLSQVSVRLLYVLRLVLKLPLTTSFFTA